MSVRRTLLLAVFVLAASVLPAHAQEMVVRTPDIPPKPRNQNVRIDVTIALKGEAKPITKSLSMVAGDGRMAKGRAGIEIPVPSQSIVVTAGAAPVPSSYNYRSVGANVDATPTILDDTHVLVRLNWQFSTVYKPETGGPTPPSFGTGSNDVFGVVFESGRPVVVSQAADGETGREYTVTITATILK